MTEVLKQTLSMWESYWDGSIYPWIFAVSVLVVFAAAFIKKDIKLNKLILYLLLIILCIFLPPSAYVISRLTGESIYWRMFWLLPVIVMIPLAGTILTGLIKNRICRAIAMMVLIGLLVSAGEMQFVSGQFTWTNNYQQIPDDIVTICSLITEDAGEASVKLAGNDYISSYVRVYDPSIYMPYGRRGADAEDDNAERLYHEMETMVRPGAVIARAREAECTYLVVDTTMEGIPEYFLERDYESIGMVDQYAILKDLQLSEEEMD